MTCSERSEAMGYKTVGGAKLFIIISKYYSIKSAKGKKRKKKKNKDEIRLTEKYK